MSRTIRRKNGKDKYGWCVERAIYNDWKTGELVVYEPSLTSWKYHGDSRWKYRPWNPWLKERLGERRRRDCKTVEYRYRMAVDHDDVELISKRDRDIIDPWFWD